MNHPVVQPHVHTGVYLRPAIVPTYCFYIPLPPPLPSLPSLLVLENKDKIPYTKKIGSMYYNMWQDEKNVKGLWRRCTLEE